MLDDKLLTLPTLLLIKMHSPGTNKKERQAEIFKLYII